jgi:hypothetical protein
LCSAAGIDADFDFAGSIRRSVTSSGAVAPAVFAPPGTQHYLSRAQADSICDERVTVLFG